MTGDALGPDSVNLTTFGWKQTVESRSANFGCAETVHSGSASRWDSEDGRSLTVMYCDVPSEITGVDSMRSALGRLATSPGLGLGALDIVELDSRIIANVRALFGIVKVTGLVHEDTDGADSYFRSTLILPFAACFWSIQLRVSASTGLIYRETPVAKVDSKASRIRSDAEYELNVDARRWDGIVPVTRDPLTEIRQLEARLELSIKLSDAVLRLKPVA